MEIIGTVYTLEAVANRIGKKKSTLRQDIKKYNAIGQPLEFGAFKLVMIPKLGYVGILKEEDLIVIEE